MKLMTVTEVTKAFQITTRTLRYYDQIGLLPSIRTEEYAYRMYDENALTRLQQILVLKQLRIPLKTIALILEDAALDDVLDQFYQSVLELDQEISALQTIRNILQELINRLNSAVYCPNILELLNDKEVTGIVQTLRHSKTKLQEMGKMNELNQANKVLSTLKNVRILYLPPCMVASSQYIGENPESGASKALWRFVQETNLIQKKPDLRVFGFNNPCPQPGKQYGYEFWVTIPEDMEVPEPLQKKQFAGGLYAAHFIQMDNFHEWQQLDEWVKNNAEYEYDHREPLGMGGCLEEHLNAYSHFREDENEANFTQFDLLSPVRKK